MGQGRPDRSPLAARRRSRAHVISLLVLLSAAAIAIHLVTRPTESIGLAVDPSLAPAEIQYLKDGLHAAYEVPVGMLTESIKPPADAQTPLDGRDVLATMDRWPRVPGQRQLAISGAHGDTVERTFVFGLGRRAGRSAVVFTPRLRHRANPTLFRQRLLRVSIHELGHVYGLRHCEDQDCVMVYSATLLALDASPDHFCPRCARLLHGWRQAT